MVPNRLAVAMGVVIAAIVLCASPTQVGAASSAKPLPVPYDFLPAAILGGSGSLVGPPGANDWTCKPSRVHPEPVILVHGILGNESTNWQTYGPLLHNNGYCVFALTYGQSPLLPSPLNQLLGGLAPIEESAQQIAAFVQRVLAATGAPKVDIVGHSEGTVVPDYYARFLGGAHYIDKYVSLAPLWAGSGAGGVPAVFRLATAIGAGPALDALLRPTAYPLVEIMPGSAYLNRMQAAGGPAVPGISYTNIVTKHDELVMPYTSGIAPGMTNEVVQDYCPIDFTEHFEIVSDPVAAQLVLNALDPAHPHPVPCRLVLPFVGTL
jgi:triacylglycerol lipase